MGAEQRVGPSAISEPPVTTGRRWAARAALVAAAGAIVAPLVLAGLHSVLLVAVGIAGLGVAAAALWWAVTHRGPLRIAGIVLACAALLSVAVLYIARDFVGVVILSAALWMIAGTAARASLRGTDPRMTEYEVPAPKYPYLIMNPRSGGGKVDQFGLVAKAEAVGARVMVLDGPERVDVAALARSAVTNGADLLGVAGGDGTQATVAGVAAEHDLPFLVIAAGTRNHFALDLGLDRDDPSRCLDALTDGVELHVDIGTVNGRPFVNNASFGAYAEVVQSPEYRNDKAQTFLHQLPDLLLGHAGARLTADVGSVRINEPQAVLVSNNPYATADRVGLGRRPRLDLGILGVVGIRVTNALQAADLIRTTASAAVTNLTAADVTVTADAQDIPVGVDGEALTLTTPVHCVTRPGALRVRVPRSRPGRFPTRPPIDWRRVRELAGGLIRHAGRQPSTPDTINEMNGRQDR
jgi:diacylglycerol kinase family enzyme